MAFLYPGFLWAFFILIIPIVIHLFNFKRYKTMYFSSLAFVKHVDEKTKATKSLKNILVLLSRLLAFAFLVLAFAQPYFTSKNDGEVSKASFLSMYIDNSFSMQSRGAEGQLLSEARENARSIIKNASLDTRFIIVTNDFSGSEERIMTKVEAFEKIDNIEFSPITRSLNEVIQWQENNFSKKNLEDGIQIQNVLLSDFQEINLKFNSKLNVEEILMYPIKLNAETDNNILIDSIWFSSPIHKVNTKNELNIRIQNNSPLNLTNTEVIIAIDSYKKTIFVDIPENQSIVTKIGYMDKSIGFKTGKVQVVDNQVFFDDTYYLSYKVKKNINVLILNDDDAIPNLSMVLDLDDYFQYTTIDIKAITKGDLDNVDLILLNGTNKISNGLTTYISDFISNGGSVALFPGKTPIPNEWNNLLSKLKLPLLGKKISTGTRIQSLNYADPFFRSVFKTENNKLNLPSVQSVFQAVSNNQSIYSPLISLQNGLPLLALSQTNGNAFMFYSSLHPDFGNFSKDALFPTLILRMSEISQRKLPEYLILGDDSRFPIYHKISIDNPVHIIGENLDLIPPSISISGVTYITLNSLEKNNGLISGNYSLNTEIPLGNISINYNRRESELNCGTNNLIIDLLTKIGAKEIVFNEVGSNHKLSTIDIDKPFSYWKICIIFTLIFVLTEMLLIRLLK
ncbi:BatA domain-containing protein [Crocinitomicaceae bacterium]|nr:BatA domain-containing protein [Crocinitomicaceae bacterium]